MRRIGKRRILATVFCAGRPTAMRSLVLGLCLGVVACASRAEDGGGIDASGGGGPGEPACETGALSCDGALVRLCTDDGGWVALEVCATPGLCNAEFGCDAPACAEGETRCDGDTFETCSPDRSAWEAVEQCVNAAHCDGIIGCR
jgi:hypothetical protein